MNIQIEFIEILAIIAAYLIGSLSSAIIVPSVFRNTAWYLNWFGVCANRNTETVITIRDSNIFFMFFYFKSNFKYFAFFV